MRGFIHGYSIDKTGVKSAFFTRGVDVIKKPLKWQTMGLQFTATGYGKRIPTEYVCRFNGKWRRVYCCIYSNIGTLYIGKLSDNLTFQIED